MNAWGDFSETFDRCVELMYEYSYEKREPYSERNLRWAVNKTNSENIYVYIYVQLGRSKPCFLHASFFLGLGFNPEDGGSMFLLNIDWLSLPVWEPKILHNSRLVSAFLLVVCLAYSSTLKMEATCSFETSVDIHRTTQHYISEDRIVHNPRCENLMSYTVLVARAFSPVVCVVYSSSMKAVNFYQCTRCHIPEDSVP
jgi:hypothetical protein